MSLDAHPASPADTRSLASRLVPFIEKACPNRLEHLTWFKADWQRSGAATATATLTGTDGVEAPVLIKLPVGQTELTWTRRLQPANGEQTVIPSLYASGDALGGYDLGWVVIERFPYGPLGRHWEDRHVARIADAAARFHAATARYPVDQPAKHEDWPVLLREAQHNVRLNRINRHKVWSKSLKGLRTRLDDLVEEWRARDTNQWLHGDLHLANAMCRADQKDGEVCLIDLAEVHAGHWVEDAVYLERQLWPRPERLKPEPPVKAIAKARKALGLEVGTDYPRLASIRRALLAATAPKFLKSEGHPVYLDACLDRLDQSLAEL